MQLRQCAAEFDVFIDSRYLVVSRHKPITQRLLIPRRRDFGIDGNYFAQDILAHAHRMVVATATAVFQQERIEGMPNFFDGLAVTEDLLITFFKIIVSHNNIKVWGFKTTHKDNEKNFSKKMPKMFH